MLRILLFGSVLSLSLSVAAAQEAAIVADTSAQEEEARVHFELGQAAYDGARYEEALSEFEQAHALTGRAELLYNIGLANERLLRWSATITAFEGYLEAIPDAINAVNVRARIRVARERMEGEGGATGDVVGPDGESNGGETGTPTATTSALGPILTIAGGAVIAGVGGALLAVGSSTLSDVEATPPETRQWSEVSGDVDRGNTFRTIGFVGLGVGVAVLVAGIVWLVTRNSGGTQSAAIPSQAVAW